MRRQSDVSFGRELTPKWRLLFCNLAANISDEDLFAARFYKGKASPGECNSPLRIGKASP